MGYKKEFSKECKNCGVEWLPDMSNKAPRRALCKKCLEEWTKEWWQEYRSNPNSNYKVTTKRKCGKPFKMENRKPHWKEINNELKKIKDRDEWKEFIRLQMDSILANTDLMNYINNTDIKETL